MRKIAWLLGLVFLFTIVSGCAQGNKVETVITEASSEMITEEVAISAEEIGANKFDWEKEKKEDPIFTWEDPYAGKSLEEITDKAGEDVAMEIMQKRNQQTVATLNYKAYYYFQSGKSEFDGTRQEKNREYESALVYLGASVYPDSLIKNIRAVACVEMHPVDVVQVKGQLTGDQAVLDKNEAMGESNTVVTSHTIMQIDRVYAGDLQEGDLISIDSVLKSEKLTEELANKEQSFLAYLFYNYQEEGVLETVPYQGKQVTEYGLTTETLFRTEGEKVYSYSSVSDVLRYDGKEKQTLISDIKELTQKYGTEWLEKLEESQMIILTEA